MEIQMLFSYYKFVNAAIPKCISLSLKERPWTKSFLLYPYKHFCLLLKDFLFQQCKR